MDFFDKLSETLLNASKDVSQKAKDLSGAAKLTMDIRAKEDQVQKIYAQIGKLYFEAHQNDEPVEFEQMTQVKETLEVIENMKKELSELKGVKVCPRCGQEVMAEDVYCKKCGAKIEDDEIIVDVVVKEAPAEDCVSTDSTDGENTEEVFED